MTGRRLSPGGRLAATLALASIASGITGCVDDVSPVSESGPVTTTAERGPVTVTVHASRARIVVGEKLQLSLTVTFLEGVEVRMPEIAETIGSFTVRAADPSHRCKPCHK